MCCDFLPWDSDFFGARIARVKASRVDPSSMKGILAWRDENAIDCLYFLVDADDTLTINVLTEAKAIFADIRLTLEHSLKEPLPIPTTRFLLRSHQVDDIPALRAIAGKSYQLSRFYFDGHFADEKCDLLYEIWIEKSCVNGQDHVIVAESQGKVAGFVTCSVEDDIGKIGLVGVSENNRGMGVGQDVIASALRWFKEQDCQSVQVVTQGRNIAAQRLYQRSGFITSSMQLWYHGWVHQGTYPIEMKGVV